MIKVKNLKKSYKNLEVLKDVNMEVKQGEVVVIIGPSGSGKSTFLRCLNYLESPDKGEIQVGHVKVNAEKISKKEINDLRKQSAMVFQHYNLFNNKTVLQNVTEALIVVEKMDKKKAEEIALENLKKVGMVDKKDNYPNTLSGGQKQRVASARAIITSPSLILADEPTGALDSKSAKMLLESMEELNENLNATIMMVTHDAFSASYARRILFIKDGKIFNELVRGNDSRKEFFEKIIEVITLLGGDDRDVF